MLLKYIAFKHNIDINEVENEIELAIDEMMNCKNLKTQLIRKRIFGNKRPSAEEFIIKSAYFIKNL